MRKLICLLAACLAVGVVAAGCGSSDDSTSTSTAALTKQEFVKQADAVCAKGNKELNKTFQELGKNASQAQQEQVITDKVLPNIQSQIDEIRALTPPSGDEAQVTAILDAAQQAVDQGKKDPSLFTEQNGGSDPFAEANKLAHQYGLKACG